MKVFSRPDLALLSLLFGMACAGSGDTADNFAGAGGASGMGGDMDVGGQSGSGTDPVAGSSGQGGANDGMGGLPASTGGRSATGGGGATGGSKATGGTGGSSTATGGTAAGTGGTPQEVLKNCGNIKPIAGHVPFQAIKRLRAGETVRVLVYGQSISEQIWWEEVRAFLQTTYPAGKLVMENHARGGCSSQCLTGESPWFLDNTQVNRLPGDVYAWNPDLILFHVYGSHTSYETIVKGFKERTKAEVLLQTDHRTKDNPNDSTGERWSQTMSTMHIPLYATRYEFSLARIWEAWGAHLLQSKLPAKNFLADDVHLNDAGNALMASFIKPYLCYNPGP